MRRASLYFICILMVVYSVSSFCHGKYDSIVMETIINVMDGLKADIHREYLSYLDEGEDLIGEIEIRFYLHSTGKTSDFSIVSSSLNHEDFEGYILAKISSIKFGELKFDDWIHYTYKFRPD